MYVLKVDPRRTMFRFYWNNGSLQGVSYFFNRLREGPWIRLNDDGTASFQGSFLDGKKNGVQRIYHMNGKIWRIEN